MIVEDIEVNSSDDVQCPTCGEWFSKQGIGCHHGQKHDEKLRVLKECEQCGDHFEQTAPYYIDNVKRFCGHECYGDHRSENIVGEDNPLYKEKSVLECKQCGEEYEVWPALEEESKFCGKECHDKYQTGRAQKDKLDTIEVECDVCGESVMRYPSTKSETTICSEKCMSEWASKKKGEDNPAWKGGYEDYYGDNWIEQRRKIRQRDNYRCQSCGIHEDEYGQELSVHHITPVREFEQVEQANELSNLVSLCRSCHSKWEGIPVAPRLTE